MTSFSERDGQSDCEIAVTHLEFGTIYFKQIKFISFIVVMFVLLSIIMQVSMKLLVGNYSHFCQISCFSKRESNQTLHYVKCQSGNVIVLVNVCQHIFLTL